MKINVVSDSIFFPKIWGGTHTAFLNNIEILRQKNIEVTVNSFARTDITHIHTIYLFGLFKLLTSKATVVTCHMTHETTAGTFKVGGIGLYLLEKYVKFFYNRADIIVVQNTKVKEEIKKLGITKKITVIPNPINPQMFKPDSLLREQGRKQYNIPQDSITVLSVGTGVARKGIEDFILLAQQFPKCKFIWVGGRIAMGMETENQKKLMKSLPDNLIITGLVDYEQMPMYYNLADILLFPSYYETQGMVIVEAAACGLPLILRDLSEYKELYDNTYIPCKNLEEFKKALEQLLPQKEMYKTMVEKSKKLAENFTSGKLADRFIKEYQSLL
jgi:1,2-diacylglycerol-3-alpha-glucose alpha-1,2-galactosyltransferase